MTGLHSLGMHANHLARHTEDGRMQAVLQWVGVGSIILMGAGAAVHLYRDLNKPHHESQSEPYPRHRHQQMLDGLDRHYRQNDGQGRGR